ncbi:DUF4143 domain-containing protein [Occultella glacieicola]|uniref:DUF4143 domain-containing protein n=2 Tax=Occultella glacieicola TaxID=2518684 RepID=A0ABY2DZB0_9MICO|nr:DUF4143 domain-containing protein [Occultella glacieicola]TDE88532.1 DUF4143 domain-containing protein [Occultella glacieicola]
MGHLGALERLMITEDQPAWSASLRSSARRRKAPKRHLADPSLAAAALDATPDSLREDLNTLGFLFESLAIRDLRVYAQASSGRVTHFRDSNGREVDAIIELTDGGWAAIEVRLGTGAVDAAAASPIRFTGDLDLETMGKPRAG